MQTKIVSQLDATGYFVGETVAYESPLEPGVFLVPAGAIDRPPPKTIEPGKRYRPWGLGWRGEDAPPQPEQAEADGQPPQPTRADEIRSRLSVIDEASVRPARAIALALANGEPAPQADAERLALLEAEAQLLRAELASLG